MASKARAQGKSNTSNSVKNLKNINVPSSSNAKKTRSMQEILGVQPLELESSNDNPLEDLAKNLSHRSSLRELQQKSKVWPQFSEWMTTIKSNVTQPTILVL